MKLKYCLPAVVLSVFYSVASAAYTDGTYVGVGQGKEGNVEVAVIVKDGKLSDVKVLKHQETEMILQAAVDNVIPEIIAKQTIDGVDSVSGATLSSDAIKAGVKDALAKAK